MTAPARDALVDAADPTVLTPTGAAYFQYRGNSVAHWIARADARGLGIDRAWQAMRDAGHGPDGNTPLHEAIATALARDVPRAEPVAWRVTLLTGERLALCDEAAAATAFGKLGFSVTPLYAAPQERSDDARDAARWRKLMQLGTCYYDTSPERPAPIWDGSKRVYFHECDEQRDMTLTEYIDAAMQEGR